MNLREVLTSHIRHLLRSCKRSYRMKVEIFDPRMQKSGLEFDEVLVSRRGMPPILSIRFMDTHLSVTMMELMREAPLTYANIIWPRTIQNISIEYANPLMLDELAEVVAGIDDGWPGMSDDKRGAWQRVYKGKF